MSQDDDPFKPPDATVLRPRPGAGRRGAADPAAPSRAGAPFQYVEPLSGTAQEALGQGLNNPLVQAASPLLLLSGQVRGTLSVPDVAGLRRHVLGEVARFEERARSLGIQTEVVLAARYALCAALDEGVLSTPWGAQSEWAQQTLLVTLHREAWGGEKFFEMLDRISADPARHINLMELQYLCLALGFAGRYQVLERGEARLTEVRQRLFRQIREHRGVPQNELSLRWRGLEDKRNPVIRYVPWWVVGAASLGILAVTFVVLYARLGSAASPVHSALATVGLEAFQGPVLAPAIEGPTLRRLLADEESRGALTVEEDNGRTLITLVAGDLFASGSASVNGQYLPTLGRVAAAINQVPGRVLVIGHTDDQPLRSMRYKDNFELSRDRAVSVVEAMRPALESPARLEYTGVGPTQPRYMPESEPQNRARNRRVEIVHVRGS
jgi:type VI secretion system protein ImpK